MSDTPLESLFQLQRETIRQTETVAEEMIRAPAEIGDLFTEGVESQRELQEQVLEVSRQSIHRSLDAVESVAEDDEIESLRDSVDEAFESLQEQQDEAIEGFEESYDSLSEELVDQLGEQIDLLVELSEQIEDQLTELIEELPEETVPEEFVDELEQLTGQFEAISGLDADSSEPTEIEIESDEEPVESESAGEDTAGDDSETNESDEDTTDT